MLARGHSAKKFKKKIKKIFAECLKVGTRQINFVKKNKKIFAECIKGWHSAKIFFKKNKKSLPSACRVGTLQSDRQRGRRRDGRFLSAKPLPSAPGALGKAFAECLIKDTRQRGLCRSIFCRVFFAECHTWQRT